MGACFYGMEREVALEGAGVQKSRFRYDVSRCGAPGRREGGRCQLTASPRCSINNGRLSQTIYNSAHVK